MLEITFRTDELSTREAAIAAAVEQNCSGNMFSIIEFIMTRAVLPEDQQALTALAKALWEQPVSETLSLFHAASLASVPATFAALERLKSEVERKGRLNGCTNDNDSIFDEAAEEGLEM